MTDPPEPPKGGRREWEQQGGELIPDFMRRMTRHIKSVSWENTEVFSKETVEKTNLSKENFGHGVDKKAEPEKDAEDFADAYWSTVLNQGLSYELRNLGGNEPTTFIVGYHTDNGYRRDLLMFVSEEVRAPYVKIVNEHTYYFRRTMDEIVRNGDPIRSERLLKRFHRVWGPEGERVLRTFWEQTQPAIVIVQKPPVTQHTLAPRTAQIVDPGIAGFPSSVGVIASDGVDTGVTVAYHALTCGRTPGFIGQSVDIGGTSGTVKSIDMISDSAFVTFPNSGNPISAGTTITVRTTPAPGYGQTAEFEGIGSGSKKSTVVVAASPTLLYSHASVQRQVLTNPDSLPGDSGCALISNNELLGFCFGGSGTSSPLLFSLWIWGDSVIKAHNLT